MARGLHRGSKDIGKSPSRGSAFARIQMNKGHLGLCEPQINPEFARQKQSAVCNRLRTEASFAEFQKNRGARLGLTDDEHRKIGQTYSCIRQSRLNTEAERRNSVRESFRGFEKERNLTELDGALSSARYQTVHIDLNKANPSSGTSTPPVLVTAGKNVQHGHNSCPIIETRKTPSAHDVYQKLVTPAIETKKPTFTQKRIIRGQNNDKPTGRKDLIKSALSSKHFYGETTCQASYKPYTNSSYLPKARQRPIWADRVVTSIGSGHWYLPFNHKSGIGTDYRIQYVTEDEVEKQQRSKRRNMIEKNRKHHLVRSEYTAQFQDQNHRARTIDRAVNEMKRQ